MIMNWCSSALAGLAFLASASTASASVIDFTDSATGTSGTILNGSITWTMDASGYLNNSQSFDGNSTPSGTGLSFETDGYGVGVNDDEITTVNTNNFEWIRVTFSAPVLVDAIYFLDLFQAQDGSSQEVGIASINGGHPIISLYASDVAGTGSGFVGATFTAIAVTEIFFTVLSSNDNYGFADGALAGIGFVAPVPLPAAGLLLLGGLGGLAAVRRRRKAI